MMAIGSVAGTNNQMQSGTGMNMQTKTSRTRLQMRRKPCRSFLPVRI